MASSSVLVNNINPINGIDVAPGATVTVQLQDPAGVNVFAIEATDSDGYTSLASINASIVNDQITKTSTFLMPSFASSVLIQAVVNNGINEAGIEDAKLKNKFKVCVRTSANLRLGAMNERLENSLAYGYTGLINDAIRAVGVSGGGGGAPTNASYLTLSANGTLTNERVLTAGSNISFVDGGANNTLTINASASPVSDASTSVKGIVQLSGDLGGTAASPTVAKLGGQTLTITTPANGHYLRYNGSTWENVAPQQLFLPTQNLSLGGYFTGTLPAANLPDATTGAKGIVQLAGNLAGTAASPTVVGIRAVAVGSTAPTTGQVLTATSGTAATWQTPAAGAGDATSGAKGVIQLAGDLAGSGSTAAAPKVSGLQGYAVHTALPSNGNVLTWDGGNSRWAPAAPSGGASDATTGAKGIVQLAQDLGGTAALPTVLSATGTSGVFTIKAGTISNISTSKITSKEVMIAAVATTNATPTTLVSIPLTPSATNKFNIQVCAVKSDFSQAATYDISVSVRATAGAYNLVATPQINAIEDNAAWDANVSIVSTNLVITVTGAASNNLSWNGCYQHVISTY